MKRLYFVIFLLLAHKAVLAQTAPYVIDQNTGKCCGGDDVGIGTSFKAAGAGQLNTVTLYHRSNQTIDGILYIYKGNGPNPDSLLRQQTVSVTSSWQNNSELIVNLNSPVPIKQDSVYTIYLIGFPLRHSSSFNSYADGTLWTAAGEIEDGDLDFKVAIGVPSTAGISKNALPENMRILLSEDGSAVWVEGSEQNTQLKLFTPTGNQIAESEGKELRLPDLSEGIYILQITNDRNIYSKKIYLR